MMRPSHTSAITAQQDEWTRRAARATIDAFNDLIGARDTDAAIPARAPVGRLSDSEKGWLCSAVIWSWISARAEQAAHEGWDAEAAVRTTGLTPDPWVAGAVAAILPKLAEALPDFDWERPVGAWSKPEVVEFLTTALGLMQHAIAARDRSEAQYAPNANRAARQINAAAGNPAMTAAELEEFNRDKPYG
jgi:hypothetical protein